MPQTKMHVFSHYSCKIFGCITPSYKWVVEAEKGQKFLVWGAFFDMLSTHICRMFTVVQIVMCSRYGSCGFQLLLHELSNFANHPLPVPLVIREL